MSRVTVVMATRNRREQALRACRALIALPEAPLVVVVDNASTDGTSAAIAQHLPEVTVLRQAMNRGAQARTVGVRHARTELVAFCDDDSGWAPGALARAAELFEQHPRLGLLAARILVGPQQRLDPVCGLMATSPLGRLDDMPGPSVLGFLACGAVVRRSAYLQVGGFHPVVFFGGEESVLAQDLAAAGWGLAYVPDVVATHFPQQHPDRRARTSQLACNALLSSVLRRPAAVPLRQTARLLSQSRHRDVRQALLDAWRGLPAALVSRTLLPPHVERQVRLLEAGR